MEIMEKKSVRRLKMNKESRRGGKNQWFSVVQIPEQIIKNVCDYLH